ncbi:winged helix-turn-helix domain-containing protein [Bradyrhizobium sp. NP1]|uniref:winged helix-turn-helix domain-containing protein n=1 Tax=Bradyrhizobium sp. NP1 TaxID=3049772 RepID=UPI0025A5DFEB|nr:winged helix-turn-helix domain-containing protein [Bradyrhizobium sp. NP1]WJR80365.1 winged helix-turn-helix domain-containing protein [Bradyrhizobium sp. NP1]
MKTPAAQTNEVISFGPFSLVANERRLTKDGAAAELSERAFDILVVLVSCPNEVVGKDDLRTQVWPNVTVEGGSLRFHIASLRGAPDDDPAKKRVVDPAINLGACSPLSLKGQAARSG